MKSNVLFVGAFAVILTALGISQGSKLSQSDFGQQGTFKIKQAEASWHYLLAIGPLGSLSTFKIVEQGKNTIILPKGTVSRCTKDKTEDISC
ncbi:MAG: hypothetical protein ACI9PC_001846 [Porticoccaceae bacterium]|jgi:hypothetical protein|tara:strand:- start:80 stop:355 length:276 start_codon:yes stop_codon:yes gene_type:complete